MNTSCGITCSWDGLAC